MKKTLTVLGVVTLVLVLTVPATASHLHRVFSKNIVNNTIRSKDIRNRTILARDIRPGAIGTGRIADRTIRVADLASSTRAALTRGADLDSVGHLLYVDDGAANITHLTYTLAQPVALADFDLTFFQELIHGSGSAGASVILGVDANGNGSYRADDLGWHLGATLHNPAELGADTFVEMDGIDPNTAKVDAPGVPQWWSPNAAGDGSDNVDPACYNTLATLLADCEDVRFEPTDRVHIVRLVLGGSSAWSDIAVRVTAPFVNGSFVTRAR
jgi:hypothetical protein